LSDERAELLEIVRDLRGALEVEAATCALPEAPPIEVPRPEPPAREVGEVGEAGPTGTTGEAGAPLRDLRQELGDCQRCGLAQTRTHLVFGEGSSEAPIVFVGEAPGYEEDRKGRPFVGPAGGMLTDMLTNVLRLQRDDVYICNVLKCRPPRNRDPQPPEVAACTPFLQGQLAAIRPRLIVALGRFAMQHLLRTEGSVGRHRGEVHRTPEGVPLIVTFHPAYLLRNAGDKRKAFEDLQLIRRTYEELAGIQLPPVQRRKRG
jgi:uracil-DNA glycosylase